MTKAFLIVLLLLLIQKSLTSLVLIVPFLLFWAIKFPKQVIPLTLISGLLYDITNNAIVGTSLIGFSAVYTFLYLTKFLISNITSKEGAVLLIISTILWQAVVDWVSKLL